MEFVVNASRGAVWAVRGLLRTSRVRGLIFALGAAAALGGLFLCGAERPGRGRAEGALDLSGGSRAQA